MGNRIRPLEWKRTPEAWLAAETFFGTYCVERNPRDGWCWGLGFKGESAIGLARSLSEDEAKAAAQADYESRILSALASDASPRGEASEIDIRREAYLQGWRTALTAHPAIATVEHAAKFKIGDRVTKTTGSSWTGRVVGTYSTALTPEGYAVESETETGSVQIYPASALAPATEGRKG
jgi:dihydrofolate reductase (trimethoprim resistance protein)